MKSIGRSTWLAARRSAEVAARGSTEIAPAIESAAKRQAARAVGRMSDASGPARSERKPGARSMLVRRTTQADSNGQLRIASRAAAVKGRHCTEWIPVKEMRTQP